MVLRQQHDLGKPPSVIACVQFGPFPLSRELHCTSKLACIVVFKSHSLEPTPAVAPTKPRGWLT